VDKSDSPASGSTNAPAPKGSRLLYWAREVGVAKTKTALTLVASKRGPQKRAARKSDWTPRMEQRFADVLADTCNVTLAGKAIKRSSSAVYAHRARSAAFRALWEAALATGYSRLELMMLERALHGEEKIVTGKDGSTKVMREYPDRIALALLKMHRESAASGEASAVDEAECEEARERIMARITRIRERAIEGGALVSPAPSPSPEGEGDCRA
jgi:hypothetical protein